MKINLRHRSSGSVHGYRRFGGNCNFSPLCRFCLLQWQRQQDGSKRW